jgi:membrane associated rhomboid family serine protease
MGLWDDIKNTFRHGSSLTRLIYVNIAVFILITIAAVFGYLASSPSLADRLIDIISVPSSFTSLLQRPWSIVTYMFVHKEILHILFNMLWLYWFGIIFLEYLDQKKLVAVYLLGGISGAVVYILSFNIFPVFSGVVSESVAIGASASVMAIVVAVAVYVPNYVVHLFLLGRVKVKYIALAIFLLTSVMDFGVNSGGKLAHFGGALFGYLYSFNLKRGHEIGKGLNKLLDLLVTWFKPNRKLRVTHKKPMTDFEYNQMKTEHQAYINHILDKIAKGGYDSLTREEKEALFKESQKKN